MKYRLLLIAFMFVTAAGGFASAGTEPTDLKLWYTKPAAKWDEALPIGSGRLGAMVFGGVADERIQFNEDTLWTGKPHDYVREGAGNALAEIREKIFAEQDVADLVRKRFLSDPIRQKAYQPFGDVHLAFAGHDTFTDYRRELDLDTAIATTTCKVGDVTFTREVFASYPDNAIVIHMTASKPDQISFELKLDSPHKLSKTIVAATEILSLTGQVTDPTANDEPGLRFEARAKVIADHGSPTKVDNGLRIEKASEVTIVLVAATSFKNFQDISASESARCDDYLAKLEGKSFAALKAAHVADHQKLFRRVTLNLGRTAQADLPTDTRINAVRANFGNVEKRVAATAPAGLDADPGLAALFFQYGRYLLIACSRPGTQPANLQGVWNDQLAPPWESKYTTNINLEMNYWPAELTNLSECHEPLYNLVDDLRVSGARTAKKQYNARGWVLHHNTDHWRGTAPINNVDGVWQTGGAWLCYHLWEHYLFTGDKEFLAKRAYPAMKEASLFFVDFLVKDSKTGYLVTNPSHSPEQAPPSHGTLTYGPTMDSQLIRSLFDNTMSAAAILGVDPEFAQQIAGVRKQLAPNQIGKHGQLQEWLQDIDAPNNNHRHMSPLWGLYPGTDITPADPKIFEAAKMLLEWRGDGSTGWSFSWRIPLWARVYDGEFSYRQLAMQFGRKTLPNLFDLCGPFQIDGNFGATAGIGEMLLQSHLRTADDDHAQEIHLLPALPKAWPTGSFTGLCARGGFEVDLTWADGKLTKTTVRSKLGNPCKLVWGSKSIVLKTEAGKTYTFEGDSPWATH